MKKSTFALLVFTILFAGIAQAHQPVADSTKEKKNRYRKSLRLFYQAGSVLPTNDFLKGENESGQVIDYFQALSFQYGIETDGRKLWQQLYNYPTWGFGFYGVNFFNDDELGSPSAIYAFINAPFVRFKKWSINYEVGFGLTYNWVPFDQETNPYQYAIGSKRTVFIDVGANADINLGKNFNLTAGFTFTHFSNGATKVPNFGINMFAPRLGLKYIFKERPEFIRQEKPKYLKEWEFVGVFSPAVKELGFMLTESGDTSYVSETYGIFTVSAGIQRQVSHKTKFGAGLDIGWDDSYNSYIHYDQGHTTARVDAGSGNKLAVGFFGSFELVVHRLSVVIQPGWYIYREDWQVPDEMYEATQPGETSIAIPRRIPGSSYQRLGLKYHVFENVFLGINIRAYDFSIADYIEWTLGYRVKWQKSYRK